MKDIKDSSSKANQTGHRERLRTRFLKDLGTSMPDYEILELLLTYYNTRQDVKPLAKKLLTKFHSIPELLSATDIRLKQEGVSDRLRAFFRVIFLIATQMNWQHLKESDVCVFSNEDYVLDYCRSKVAGLEIEEFHAIFLNSQLKLIEDVLVQKGTVNAVAVHPREVLKLALNNGATSVILYHNHPGGSCQPSNNDLLITQKLVDLFTLSGIKVWDHLIITKDNHFSFSQQNLIEPRVR